MSNPGANGIFHVCTKHVTSGMTWNFRILNPNNSVFDSWDYTSISNRTTSVIGWSRTLPTLPGVYTFEGTFNGITCNKTFTILSTVPIELVSFTGECDGKNRILKWTTASESNNSFFTIENSKDGKNWKILSTTAGSGNSSTKKDYFWKDTNPYDAASYFRLKQTDFSGESKYTSIISLKACGDIVKRNLELYPNPASDFVTLNIENLLHEDLEIKIYNILGTLVKVERFSENIKVMNVRDLSTGTYVVSIKSPEFTGNQKLIIK